MEDQHNSKCCRNTLIHDRLYCTHLTRQRNQLALTLAAHAYPARLASGLDQFALRTNHLLTPSRRRFPYLHVHFFACNRFPSPFRTYSDTQRVKILKGHDSDSCKYI